MADSLPFATRRQWLEGAGLTVLALALPGCSEVQAAPRPVKWGRDLCEHCHMVMGDKRFSAQVWDPATHRPHVYDDFGCAVLGAAELKLIDRADAPFWVARDGDSAQWLDARKALYKAGAPTPMNYGFVAGAGAAYTVAFTAAAETIRKNGACEPRP